MGNVVAIVGRPNVGKSTLFNRLIGSRQAIVNDEAGTTRDRQYGKVEWAGREFSVIDTGGWVVQSDDVFEEEINKQVKIAVEEADVILFVVDVMNGATSLDDEVAHILRCSGKPVILAANKADTYDRHAAAAAGHGSAALPPAHPSAGRAPAVSGRPLYLCTDQQGDVTLV